MSRSLRTVKRDVAERLAATEVEELTVNDARRVIGTFLAELARCPVCDGSGEFTFGRDVQLPTMHSPRLPTDNNPQYIEAGTLGSCPYCGSRDEDESGKGDPEWVAWVCLRGLDVRTCRGDRDGSVKDRQANHAECGWRVTFPFPVDP